MKLPLDQARICLECDTIHDLPSCPECGSETFYWLTSWLPAREPAQRKPEQEKIAASMAKALRPDNKKKRHVVRNTLIAGGALFAAYQFFFRPAKKKDDGA